MKSVSKKGRLYQINLEKKEGDPFSYQKYSNVRQLGRHFGLTVNGTVTRLYTLVNFLTFDNTNFLKRYLKAYERRVAEGIEGIEEHEPEKNKDTEHTNKSMSVLPTAHSIDEFRHSIPIMFKAYDGGKLT